MKPIFKNIGRLFKGFWRVLSVTRQLFLNLFFLVMLGVLYFSFTTTYSHLTSSEEAVVAPTPRPLLVDISGTITEKQQLIDPYDFAMRNFLGQHIELDNVLYDIVERIRQAAIDPQINGLVLSLTDMSETSLTKLRYIAKAVSEFKSTGKKVVAIGGHFTQSQYYLASYADEVIMSPDGGVLLQGYGAYGLYFKDLFEKLAIDTHVFRVGTYKSFVEPYTRTGMSKSTKEATAIWLNQLWGEFVSDIAKNRNIDVNALNPSSSTLIEAMKTVKGNFAEFAKNLGLVDALMTRPEIRKKLADQFGSNDKDSFDHVSIYDYHLTPKRPVNSDEIGVVVVSGPIIDGQETEGTAGGDTIAQKLRDAKLNDKIKAVVLRVDTPGGSAFASEVIRNEIVSIKEAGKPVVVSMSTVAASGGYWISASANKIMAQPTTITGSIGIFGILTTFQDTLAKYGVYNDGIGTTPFAGIGLTRELPKEASEIMQLSVENGYQRFITLVASQRNIPIDGVEKVAQGRVWTGYDAMEKGLVDQMGDFDDAINEAAELAGIESFSLNWMEKPLSATELFILELLHQASVRFDMKLATYFPSIFSELAKQVKTNADVLTQLNDPNGMYALCPTCTSTKEY